MFYKNVELISAIRASGLSVSEAAKLCNVTTSKMSSALNGFSAMPPYASLKPLREEIERRLTLGSTGKPETAKILMRLAETLRDSCGTIRRDFIEPEYPPVVRQIALNSCDAVSRVRSLAIESARHLDPATVQSMTAEGRGE